MLLHGQNICIPYPTRGKRPFNVDLNEIPCIIIDNLSYLFQLNLVESGYLFPGNGPGSFYTCIDAGTVKDNIGCNPVGAGIFCSDDWSQFAEFNLPHLHKFDWKERRVRNGKQMVYGEAIGLSSV